MRVKNIKYTQKSSNFKHRFVTNRSMLYICLSDKVLVIISYMIYHFYTSITRRRNTCILTSIYNINM